MKLLTALLIVVAAAAPFARGQAKPEPPVPVRTVAPDYPEDLRRQGLSGVVTVKCSIDVQGNVTDAQVEKTTNAGFDSAAINAVKKWKFKPAQRDGSAIPISVAIPIKFVATDS